MNKPSPMLLFSLVLVGQLLQGCGEQASTPPLELPTLQRPVMTLETSARTQVQRLFIPASAYVERSGLPGVYVLSEGQARFRMVRIGQRNTGRLEVLSGLSGNETLILGDLAQIHDGSPIVVK